MESGIIIDANGVEHYRISCGDSLDISMATQLQSMLLQAMESGFSVELAAAEVMRADTAALQVLCAFCQDMNASARDISWMEPSESLCRAAELLGLTEMLSLVS